jgi:hypothetical protein
MLIAKFAVGGVDDHLDIILIFLFNKKFANLASKSSFIRGTLEAAVQHQHLLIRPEDVWFTILTQLSFYLSKYRKDTDILDIFDTCP